jgi:tetratricopeptide (TPR) repeat protein
MIAGLFVALCVGADPVPVVPAAEARTDALAQYGAAVWNLRRDRLLSATKQLEAAAKQDPTASAPKRELAKLYAQLGRDPEAIRHARAALETDPDDSDTALLLAKLLFDAGELADAIDVAKVAVESKSLTERPEKAVRAYRDLAALCEKADDRAAAEAALRKAVDLLTDGRADVIAQGALTPKEADAEAADCLERLGRVLVKRKKYAAAVEAFERAAKLFPDPSAAARLSWNLSGALDAKGDRADALAQLETFLKLKPRAGEPFVRYAKLLREAGTANDEVVLKLQAHAARDPGNKPLAAVVAWEQTRGPDRDTGGAALAKLIESADPELVALFVRAHLDTGRARAIVTELDKSFVLLDEARRDKEKPIPELAKRRAAEKARAVADALATNPDGAAALLRAAGDDLRLGVKRASGTAFFMGALAQRHGKLVAAELHFRNALNANPQTTIGEVYQALFNVLWLAGKPGDVEALCAAAIGNPEVPLTEAFLNFHYSLALAEVGKADAAVRAADKAILNVGDTDRLTVRLRKHTVLRALGKWDEAIEYGKKLLDEFDAPADKPRVRYAQANALWGGGKRAEAEALLRAMLDDDPDHAGACNDLGYHLADEGRNLAEAERLIRRALTADRIERRKAGSAEGENASYLDSLGWVQFRQGKVKEARATLERAAALSLGPNDATVWDHLGDVLFRLNEKAKAREAWERAKAAYEADASRTGRDRYNGRLDEVKRKLARAP